MSTIKNTKNPELSDSVVLITGALTGIGRATALAFAKEKSSIVISGRHTDEGNKLATELRTYGAKAEFILADVTHDDEISNLIRKTVDKFGKIDIAVNNAGTEGQPGLVVDQTAESYAATFDTNVLGTLLSMKHEMKLMIDQGHGSIINVSSTLGRKGYPGASVYSASKHAVEGLTKSAALEVAGSGIRINVVAPGPIETPMLSRFTGTEENKKGLASSVPAGRIGLPEEVAQTILFIGSNKAPYLTGQSIAIDGGILA
ncbi:MAG: glucose 1-dehydrogenase [Gemmatimonadaceae bacterium]|nr:glucose 1-dehydrogenase [Chitinophagaceae bacterium]